MPLVICCASQGSYQPDTVSNGPEIWIQRLIDILTKGFPSCVFALQRDSGCHRTMSPVVFCSFFATHLLVSLTDIHSLICDIIVNVRTTPGQSWCEGQYSLDGKPFLQYDNDNKATPLGDLGKVADGTQVWTDMIQALEYLGQEFRKMLANSIQEMTETSGKYGIEY